MGEEDTKRRPALARISTVSQASSPDESPEVTSLQTAILNFDVNRIEELILVTLFDWSFDCSVENGTDVLIVCC